LISEQDLGEEDDVAREADEEEDVAPQGAGKGKKRPNAAPARKAAGKGGDETNEKETFGNTGGNRKVGRETKGERDGGVRCVNMSMFL
jgi:hypothetical protein